MKILLTARGFVGSNILNLNKEHQIITNPVWENYSRTDLRNKNDVSDLFMINPDLVIHTASRVAGLGGHKKHSEFLHDNLLINTNVVEACRKWNCRLIALSSVAAFPGNLNLLTENSIYESEVHSSEFGYGLSKRMLDTQIQLYRKEYGCNFCCLFPVNIYGKYDNFNLETAHVIPTLIHKFYLAKKNNETVQVWGDGKSLREFIYVEDLAKLILHLVPLDYLPDRLIVSNPVTYSIKDVVDLLIKITEYDKVEYINKNNGLRVRETNVSKMKFYYKEELTPLEKGLTETWKWFNEHYNEARTN